MVMIVHRSTTSMSKQGAEARPLSAGCMSPSPTTCQLSATNAAAQWLAPSWLSCRSEPY